MPIYHLQVLKEINPDPTNPLKVPKSIIFVSRKSSCDELSNTLWNLGYSVDSLHGDKQQFLRTKVRKGLNHVFPIDIYCILTFNDASL